MVTLAAGALLSVPAFGQSVTGTISGTVTDPNGAIVPGAAVKLMSDQTKDERDQVTNDSGRFSFASVQPGVYTIKVEHQGFETLLRTKIVLSANESLALGDLPLKTGQVSETVTVASEGQVVEKESSDLTARLTANQISLISTKGRDITSLLRLIPGTSNDDDVEAVGEGFGTNLPNISGQRGRSTVTMIDGLNASEPSGSNKISMTINQDAVAEVKILRNNYAAEYGNNGGAMITIVAKGGGSEYRGSAYYFLRNEALNATPFFINQQKLPKPQYRHKIPGFNFGGPLPLPRFGEGGSRLWRDKAFFFISMEKPHTITPTDPVTVTMPTALERIGDFSKSIGSNGQPVVITDPRTNAPFPGNIIPAAGSAGCGVSRTCIDPSGQALLNFFPLPNAATASNPGRYVFQKSVDVPKHSYVYRLDFKLTKKDSVYWKAQWWTSDNLGLGTSGWPSGDANRWGILSHYLYKDNGWSANWTRIMSSSVVNEFNFGMRHDSEGFVPGDGMVESLQRSALNYTAPQLFPQNNHLGTIPRATGWSGVAGTPANINWLDRWGEIGNDYIKPSFADNLSYVRGNHSLKFGVYFERVLNGEAPGGQWSGVFNFDNNSAFTTALGATNFPYANALVGNFRTYTESSARPFTNLSIKTIQWYAQDEWKVNRKLSVNYGMRWLYASPFTQFDKQGSNFDPALYNPAKAPLLYFPACVNSNGTPFNLSSLNGAACPTANRRAFDPRTPTVFLTNTNLVGTFVRNPDGSVVGDLNNGLALGNDPNTPKGYRKTNAVSWEPRVGFAYSLNDKTVLRAMGGIYHTVRVGGGTTGGNLVNNPPANRSFSVGPCAGCSIENLINVLPGALNSPGSVNAVEVNSKRPTIYNFQLGIQRDIGNKTVIEVSYVGSLARHLGERRNINQVPDNAHFIDLNAFGPNCNIQVNPGCTRNPFSTVNVNGPHLTGVLGDNFLRPYQGFGDITMTMWSGTSNYNGLQVQVNRRYTSGFEYGVAYTYSKTFDYSKDDDTGDVFAGRPYKAFNYAPADFDQTHILTFNYIYDLPKLGRHWKNGFAKAVFDNWQISGTTSYATGKPKTFGTGTGLNWSFSGGSYTISNGQVYLPTGTPCAPGFAIAPGSSTTPGANVTCTYTGITDFTGGDINARPDLICDPNTTTGATDSSGLAYAINPACFVKPGTAGSIGSLPRNVLRLPPIFNNDIAFFKNIKFGERREIQLRWEIYNVFNHPNFSDINGAMTFAPNAAVTQLATGGTCPAGTAVVYNAGTFGSTAAPARCGAAGSLGQVFQTAESFGTPRAARAPRVMQASIRINF
jgi:hypothetical protein